jgi:hypothetical protein
VSKPPAPGLASRLRDGSATEDEQSWAVRRVSVLQESFEQIGLSEAELDELRALERALGTEVAGG